MQHPRATTAPSDSDLSAKYVPTGFTRPPKHSPHPSKSTYSSPHSAGPSTTSPNLSNTLHTFTASTHVAPLITPTHSSILFRRFSSRLYPQQRMRVRKKVHVALVLQPHNPCGEIPWPEVPVRFVNSRSAFTARGRVSGEIYPCLIGDGAWGSLMRTCFGGDDFHMLTR
jgi:hypothetical protein